MTMLRQFEVVPVRGEDTTCPAIRFVTAPRLSPPACTVLLVRTITVMQSLVSGPSHESPLPEPRKKVSTLNRGRQVALAYAQS